LSQFSKNSGHFRKGDFDRDIIKELPLPSSRVRTPSIDRILHLACNLEIDLIIFLAKSSDGLQDHLRHILRRVFSIREWFFPSSADKTCKTLSGKVFGLWRRSYKSLRFVL